MLVTTRGRKLFALNFSKSLLGITPARTIGGHADVCTGPRVTGNKAQPTPTRSVHTTHGLVFPKLEPEKKTQHKCTQVCMCLSCCSQRVADAHFVGYPSLLLETLQKGCPPRSLQSAEVVHALAAKEQRSANEEEQAALTAQAAACGVVVATASSVLHYAEYTAKYKSVGGIIATRLTMTRHCTIGCQFLKLQRLPKS